jgi:hypothetical protein
MICQVGRHRNQKPNNLEIPDYPARANDTAAQCEGQRLRRNCDLSLAAHFNGKDVSLRRTIPARCALEYCETDACKRIQSFVALDY